MTAIYVPANGQQFESYWKVQPDLTYHGFDIRHFTEKSFFRYKYSLTNAYYNLTRKIIDVRSCFRYPTDEIVIGDSGGFQIAANKRKGKTMDIEPMAILRWMESNVNIGMNLDMPLWGSFQESLKWSKENFGLFQSSRSNYDMKLYNIQHGRNLSEIRTWYDMAKEFQFDGWAIGIKPSNNVLLQLLGFVYLHEHDALNLKNGVHFFGVSGVQNMIALAILSEHFGMDITFDSSSFNMGSRIRAYYLPWSVRNFASFGRNQKKIMTKLPCNCPVCQNTTVEELYNQETPLTPVLLSLHNLYQFITVNNEINCMAKDPEVLMEYARSINEQKLTSIVYDFLTRYDSVGYLDTYNKFKYEQMFVQRHNRKFNLTGYV